MQLRSPLSAPRIDQPFRGRALAAVLEDRTRLAVEKIQRLDLPEWEADSPAPAVAAWFDVEVPAIGWDDGAVQIGATDHQRMRAVLTWPVSGDAGMLTYRPSRELLGSPPTECGVGGSRVVATVEGSNLTAAQLDRAAADTRSLFERNLTAMSAQVDAWRPFHSRAVRDAARHRLSLLQRVTDLQGDIS